MHGHLVPHRAGFPEKPRRCLRYLETGSRIATATTLEEAGSEENTTAGKSFGSTSSSVWEGRHLDAGRSLLMAKVLRRGFDNISSPSSLREANFASNGGSRMNSMPAEETQYCDDDSCDDFEEAAEVCTRNPPLPVFAHHFRAFT